jgi:hypothetical protein
VCGPVGLVQPDPQMVAGRKRPSGSTPADHGARRRQNGRLVKAIRVPRGWQ